jgi:NADPH:quinone reductase-like Zn-dependent oxidoreductase
LVSPNRSFSIDTSDPVRQKIVSVGPKDFVEAGNLKPAVERRYPFEQAVEALKELEKGHARGKSVVVMD